MTQAMEQKLQMINKYIADADEIEKRKDIKAAERYVDMVLGIYLAEIPGLKNNLDRFRWKLDNEKTDHLFDLSLLREKLRNHKLNLQSGLYTKFFSETGGNVTVTQNSQQSMENVVTLSLDQTIEVINKLPEETLSPEEKIELAEKLASIFAAKDKKTKWDKAQGILKWLGDKGVEVGLAALPYIVQSLQ